MNPEAPAAAPVRPHSSLRVLEKCPTGIDGLDEVLDGGAPRGRPVLVVGAAGCGKTVFGMEFLVHGALTFGEPGVFVSFEERNADLEVNFAGMGFDLAGLVRDGKLRMDHIQVDPAEIQEAGEYDLEGLFIRLDAAIRAIGAKRVVLDTLEVLFAGLTHDGTIRSELRRLFEWLKDRGVTTIVTAEPGASTMTRHGLEEYVADCVILLENAVDESAAVRRLRVVKYRGSAHGANVYPFLIDNDGISVLPITSLRLDYPVSSERLSSGIERLDVLLGGGIYRGSSVLIMGTAGCGKTSVAATFADAACRRGERVLFLAFEESPAQIVRNMASIGLDLTQWIEAGRLEILSTRPTAYGLETHLAEMHRAIERVRPELVVVDPVSNFIEAGSSRDTSALLARLIDLMKSRGMTAIFTSLTRGGSAIEASSTAISSIMDSWILLRDIETNGERNHVLHVLKSRGSDHSNQVREFVFTSRGIQLMNVYTGPGGMALGTARLQQEAADRATAVGTSLEAERRRRDRQRRRDAMEAKIAAMRAEFDASDAELAVEASEAQDRVVEAAATERLVSARRQADARNGGQASKRSKRE